MEWKSNLRRTQSLRTVSSSSDQATWTDAGLRDKTISVSRLVARYQTTVEVSTSVQETLVDNDEAKPEQSQRQSKATPSLLESKETHLEALLWRNNEKERSRTKTSLARSKSVGSLQNSTGSIDALKALFESKAAIQNKAASGIKAVSFPSPYKAADIVPVMNGEVEKVKSPAEKPKPQTPADTPVNDAKDHVTRKVVNQTRTERRKTIGGIDFEKIVASEANEKRKSIGDFRDSSFIQTKEQLCVSVKAISALYQSKVAPQESTNSPVKLVQDQSSESGKRVKLTKMAEDSQQRKDDLPPHPLTRHEPGTEDIAEAHFQQSMPSQLSKEKLYQQRQKCELRRLLKHTHPELKMLDDVVDEELAEVLSSETGVTTGEIGYEGEVFSRRLIFETCALSDKLSSRSPKRHVAEGTAETGDVSTTSAVFEECEVRSCSESVKGQVEDDKTLGPSPDPNTECEEEMMRIDVQATRRIFENRSMNASRLNPDNMFQGKNSICKTGAVQDIKQQCREESPNNENKSNACSKSTHLIDQPLKQGPYGHITGQSTDHDISSWEGEISSGEALFEDETISPPDPDKHGQIMKTSATLLKNNPFIPRNIEREQSFVHTSKSQSTPGDRGVLEDYCPTANVKNRTHLFESITFDKIRQQDLDEVETMVENIKETLNSLYLVNAITSGGSIIEVNETMIAKKAKFTLSKDGPNIKYDEVAEGGAQNFILQLLPRGNLKPQITYLKEDSKGSIEATVVNVPVHQHRFPPNQDTECKTANVVQVVEDILNQDNSLRKGVVIQEHLDRYNEVIVYSLYNYFDEEDVKRYCPAQGAEYVEPEPERDDVRKTDNLGLRKGAVESTISCLLETFKDQSCQGTRPDITAKGNVKLFKSCIEKGDLGYLKSLQSEPTEQKPEPPNKNLTGQAMEDHYEQKGDQAAEESTSEWVPVDVKRLKNIFSGDQRPVQPKQNAYDNLAQSTTSSFAYTGQNVPLAKSQSCKECNVGVYSHEQGQVRNNSTTQLQEACHSTVAAQVLNLHLEAQDDYRVHQAELVEVVDESDEISNLQTAIYSLQQATKEAKTLFHSSQEKLKFKHSELSQKNENQKEDLCMKAKCDELQAASNITSEYKSDHQQEDTGKYQKDMNSKVAQPSETCNKIDQTGTENLRMAPMAIEAAQQEDEEVVFQGKLQAALNSLEKSNINVSRGDFRAAMIYRNSSQTNKERPQNAAAVSVQKPTVKDFGHVTEPKSTQVTPRQQISKAQVTPDPQSQNETHNVAATSAAIEKSKRTESLKPVIPPKPQHLNIHIQSSNTKNPEVNQTNTVRSHETVPQPLTSLTHADEHQEDLIKINSKANSTSDSMDLQRNEPFDKTMTVSPETEERHQVQGSDVTVESDNRDKNTINQQQEINITTEDTHDQDFPVKEHMNETDESHVDFHEACKKFGGKKVFSVKNAPVKPKRVKIAQPDSKTDPTGPSSTDPITCGPADSEDKHNKEIKEESKVEMREKRGRTETEDERRQRLSVHMDEIMRGNITAAMEIFDNLRKQEELKSILSRVEEIEQDTSEVDVRSLRGVFENVPDWVVNPDKKKQKKGKVENMAERLPLIKDNTESKSSMAHIFGDLERASEEIMNLKEQTLARLMDIEGAIKKALYSVSTLKSDSDIAGLSCLFKESLGTVQGSPSSSNISNISKISIGSSKNKSVPTQEGTTETVWGNTTLPVRQSADNEVTSPKQRVSPPSSPAFISIQSAARKTDKTDLFPHETTICATCQHSPKTEETYRTTKILTCNSPAQNRKGVQKQLSPFNPKRELSVLEVQTDHEGNNIIGTKTVTENIERTDNFGNRFYSSKTSTVVTTQPETATPTGQAVASPSMYQVTKYPEVRLPINQKP